MRIYRTTEGSIAMLDEQTGIRFTKLPTSPMYYEFLQLEAAGRAIALEEGQPLPEDVEVTVEELKPSVEGGPAEEG